MVDIAGVILAGGKGTRMGTDKALLKIGGKTIIEDIWHKFKALFKEIIIISNNPERFAFLEKEAKIFPDIIASKGPLGGIYTGLKKSVSFYNFVTACDMPYVNTALIKHVIESVNSYDAMLPYYNNRPQPLFAVYSKRCIEPIENSLHSGKLRITDFIKYIKTGVISENEIKEFDPDALSFVNINTVEEYERLKKDSGYQDISISDK